MLVSMYTIIETPTFEADASKIWTEEERNAFFAWQPIRKLVIPFLVAVDVGRFAGRLWVQENGVGCELFTSPSWQMVRSGCW